MTQRNSPRGRAYAELVLHVLAHVPLPEPGSLHEPAYVAWCVTRLGPSAQRELGEDVQVLGQLLTPLEPRIAVQWLSALFVDSQAAARCALVDLPDFPDQGVRSYDEAVWRQLLPLRPVVEVLRMACEAERMHLEQTSPPNPDPELTRYLAELNGVAPGLAELEVRELRPLWRRGRLMGARVWVGAATQGEGPGVEHVAWQACHEATVWELGRKWRSGAAYALPLECAAVALLGERARRGGFEAAHGSWFAHLAEGLPRGIEALSEMAARLGVPEALLELVQALLRR